MPAAQCDRHLLGRYREIAGGVDARLTRPHLTVDLHEAVLGQFEPELLGQAVPSTKLCMNQYGIAGHLAAVVHDEGPELTALDAGRRDITWIDDRHVIGPAGEQRGELLGDLGSGEDGDGSIAHVPAMTERGQWKTASPQSSAKPGTSGTS